MQQTSQPLLLAAHLLRVFHPGIGEGIVPGEKLFALGSHVQVYVGRELAHGNRLGGHHKAVLVAYRLFETYIEGYARCGDQLPGLLDEFYGEVFAAEEVRDLLHGYGADNRLGGIGGGLRLDLVHASLLEHQAVDPVGRHYLPIFLYLLLEALDYLAGSAFGITHLDLGPQGFLEKEGKFTRG